MAASLSRLRGDLDLMPSPLPEQPGLLVRDPFNYSTTTLVIPPVLVRCLRYFDGQHDEDDLRAAIARVAGAERAKEVAGQLVTSLRDAGFLDDERFAELRARRERAFASAPERSSAHAGSGYPAEGGALSETLRDYLDGARGAAPSSTAARKEPLLGIAAPHVSPFGGRTSYGVAYRALAPEDRDRIFVVAGTSHYGEPDRFGLTQKPFSTPFGLARTERRLVTELAAAAGDAVTLEDYCHAVEHSVEFQVVFLQHLFGANVRILPILCGPFLAGPAARRPPEASEPVARFIGALGEIAAREGRQLCFVLGVDYAHIGRRYGDGRPARAHEGDLVEVEARDRARLARVGEGDGAGFWELVSERGDDDLRWCGSSPIYTFLRAVPEARGQLLSYEHWNIDDASVVSFGAMTFGRRQAPRARASRGKRK